MHVCHFIRIRRQLSSHVRYKINISYLYYNHLQCVLSKGRSFTANSGSKAAVLPKGKSSSANSGTKFAVLLGMNRCGGFPLPSAPHSLFTIWTDLKISHRHQWGGEEREDLANWALRSSPKFTTGVKYQFCQGFWSDQRSGNPNHPSPPLHYNYIIIIGSFLIKY